MKRGRDGLYQRRGYFYFKFKTVEGQWKEHATRSKDRQEARRRRTTFQRELEAGQLPTERSDWPLGRAADTWHRNREFRISRGSYLSEGTTIRHIVRVLGAETRLIKIADIHEINRYEDARLREGRKPKTVNNEVLAIAGILKDANLWHRVASRYKPLKVPRSEIGQALTREQECRLLAVAQTSSDGAIAPYAVVLAGSTGMRTREIRHLQLDAIHLNVPEPFIEVRRSTTKSDCGSRYVALGKVACWALQKLLDRAKRIGATKPDHYLLPTLLDRHTREQDPLHGKTGYDPSHPMSSWAGEWDSIRQAAGLGNIRFHDLRHTYITRAAEAGVPIQVTQAQVGHMSAAMTAHYTHISVAAIHKAAKQIERNRKDLLKQLNAKEMDGANVI